MAIWNPWHGCHKFSAGCLNCYVYRRDQSVGRDASQVEKTKDFDLPIQRDSRLIYKLQPEAETVFTCMTSDFFLEDADAWRPDCWKMMRKRSDLHFMIITKRIQRFADCLPPDWGEGYPNVTIGCTCENQKEADRRLPVFLSQKIQHKVIIHEPMLGPIDISQYLSSGGIEKVICGGESGENARLCSYTWILSTRQQCIENHTEFCFKQTGALFEKDDKIYRIERPMQQLQAAKAAIDYIPEETETHQNREFWLAVDLFQRIQRSRFRSRFQLNDRDLAYIREKGMDVMRSHAEHFVRARLSPACIPNDGRQTPMKGHPVFLAQHACACCCRECLQKWHGIPQGRELTQEEQKYIIDTLMEWICRQSEKKGQITFL